MDLIPGITFAHAQWLLELLKILLSWPSAALILGGYFIWFFRPSIGAMLDRIASIKLPGGSEVLMPQASRNLIESRTEPKANEENSTAAPGDDAERRRASERERATIWEYRYLNYYLVPKTQIALDWLANRSPMTVQTIDAWMMTNEPNALERIAVINALLNHHLVQMKGDLVEVTPKGREYITWRGPLHAFLNAWRGTPISPPAILTPEPPVSTPSSLVVPAIAPTASTAPTTAATTAPSAVTPEQPEQVSD